MATPKQSRPKGYYLSYSRASLYHANPREYYVRYVLGVKQSESQAMRFGTIGHRALERKNYNWKKALRHSRFLSHDEVVMEKALAGMERCPRNGVRFHVKWDGIPLFGFIDGLDPQNGILRERKFSDSIKGSEMADEHMQLRFYWLALSIKGFNIKKGFLDVASRSTGQVVSYPITFTKRDLEMTQNWIRYAHDGITRGVWS